MTNEASRWDKLNAISHFKAHLKYRDTTASETVANDREKCALKWLFVWLVVETDTVQNTVALWKITLVRIQEEPPAKAAFKRAKASSNLLE